MRIAFNPSTVAALTTPPNNKDITFDLRGRNIFARGVKFYGTDTNTWRDVKINNVSIGTNILNLRNGSNTTLTNTNGVVTINSTWRPVVDNLTSDSTTSSLSANQGRVLAGLINTLDTNISNQYALRNGSNATGRWEGGLSCFDVRDTDYTPHDLNMGLELLFLNNNTNNLKDGGVFNGVFSFRQWSSGSDWAGGKAHQLSFTDNENIWHRTSSGDDSWGAWKKLAYSTDIPSSLKNPYALTISLNGASQGPYDGSATKSINITPGSIGAATSNHNHDGRYVYNYGGTPMDGASIDKNALGMTTNSGITGDWWHILQAAGNDEYRWNSQIAFPTQNRNGMYYRSGLDDNTKWGSWVKLLDVNNYPSTLDSRYYTESEVNSLLSTKLDRVNLTVGGWNPRGYNLAADYWYNGGDLSISESGGQIHVSVDGYFWQNEGQYRVLDTSDIGSIREGLTLYQYLSSTDNNWFPLIWGGNDHKNTSNSTGSLCKSYDKLSWQTSSQTLYATNIQTENIKHLSIGGGIYWNPNVEAASDSTDAASITLVKAGVAGGTTLVLSQMNDANDTIQFKTSTAARLYHNSYPILTTQNTYVSNNKGYINGIEITQVNNSDTVDGVHLEWSKALTYDQYSWLAAWTNDGKKIKAVNKNQFATSSHTHSYYAVNENYGGFKKAERLPTSGFYQSNESESGGNAPWKNWMYLINCQHSNTSNNHALQIAASFFDNNTFKIRVTNNMVNNAWRDIIHSGNIGSQSVNYANSAGNADTVDGYHATDGRTFNGDINWGSWGNAWSDGTNKHPWYGFDHRYPNTGAYSTTITDYFGMTIKTANTLRLDFSNLLLNGTSIYDINVASATKVIVNQHTSNDTNYPLVWSNQSNDSSVTENQLFKSWVDLYYNPKNKILAVGGHFRGPWARFTNQNGALVIGDNTNARISAIGDQIIFNTGSALRFGETAWDWNQWAGLKYTHSTKTIYLGIADGSTFGANIAQSGGTINLRAGVSTIETPNINFGNITSGLGYGLEWTCGNNDFARIKAGATGSNAGYLEIATAEDGTEPIYVRQYTGVFGTVTRTLTLLDASGYSYFPSYINIGGNENNNSSPDRVWGSNSSDSFLRSYRTSALNVNYASSAGNASTLGGTSLGGIFTAFGNNAHNITATIGGVTKQFQVNYASDADKVDGVHVTWAGALTSTSHLVAWESDGSALRDINPANVSVGSANYASSAGNADKTRALKYTGTGNNEITAYQTDASYMGRSGWASYIICNHGDGSTYYSQTIAMPFQGSPIYRRLESGTDRGWKKFYTEEAPPSWSEITGKPTIPNPTDYYWANNQITTSPKINAQVRVSSLGAGCLTNIANTVMATNWLRATGSTGIYFQDHAGGLYMSDNIWIRTYNNKAIMAKGYAHSSHNSDDAVLLAGGGYAQGVPIKYYGEYSVSITSGPGIATQKAGNFKFVTDSKWNSSGVAKFTCNYPQGYNIDNTFIWAQGKNLVGTTKPLKASILEGVSSTIFIHLTIGDTPVNGYCNLYFICF